MMYFKVYLHGKPNGIIRSENDKTAIMECSITHNVVDGKGISLKNITELEAFELINEKR